MCIDVYVVTVGGTPWLQSGGLRIFVNGEWHQQKSTVSPSPPKPAACTVGKPNTGLVGTKTLRSFSSATDATCCAACGDNMRTLVLYVRQARAEAHIQIYIKVWIQGGGWVDEGT